MISKILFWSSAFLIIYTMIIYPAVIIIIGKFSKKINVNDDNLKKSIPNVSVIIPAHNEEKVIIKKINNILSSNYPLEKLKIIISSDNSTDSTNSLVRDYIINNKINNVSLHVVQKRMGKTNAQDEAVELTKDEFLVFTDANSLLDRNSILRLIKKFSNDTIAYVCGRLVYVKDDNITSKLENTYWDIETTIRKIEGDLQTITAGNGALYCVRKSDYLKINLIESHDSAMPFIYAKNLRRAIACNDSLVFEKTGNSISEEYKRKVRMNRNIFRQLWNTIYILNVFKYKWFTFFYLGHRTFRYLLWISHLNLLISNIYLAFISYIYLYLLIGHVSIYLLVIFQHFFKTNNKWLNFIYYYIMTVIAQWNAVLKSILGKNKAFWEKAETTRV